MKLKTSIWWKIKNYFYNFLAVDYTNWEFDAIVRDYLDRGFKPVPFGFNNEFFHLGSIELRFGYFTCQMKDHPDIEVSPLTAKRIRNIMNEIREEEIKSVVAALTENDNATTK